MIYLDNAATSFPKPEPVLEAVTKCLTKQGGNPGRGSHKLGLEASRIVFDAREKMAEFLGVKDSANVIFTGNCTEALNLALKGYLEPGDHVVTTSIEHNSVSRPLEHLKTGGIVTTKVQCGRDGALDLDDLRKAMAADTRMVVATHASNLIGNILPVAEIAKMAHEYGAVFLIDAAQSAGVLDLNVEELGCDFLAFSGHKGMCGPQGTGVLYVSPHLQIQELMQGGTGLHSESINQSLERPERYESGTPNTPGIAGLGAAIGYLLDVGLDTVREHELSLMTELLDGLAGTAGVTVYGPAKARQRVGVVAINVSGIGANEVAYMLDQNYGIAVRAGLHCAPDAHRTLGTLEIGAVRFGLGYMNTKEDVGAAVGAVAEIASEHGSA